MKALITDGKRAGRIVRLSESEIDLSGILQKDSRTGAYRMTEADATWLGQRLNESYPRKTGQVRKWCANCTHYSDKNSWCDLNDCEVNHSDEDEPCWEKDTSKQRQGKSPFTKDFLVDWEIERSGRA